MIEEALKRADLSHAACLTLLTLRDGWGKAFSLEIGVSFKPLGLVDIQMRKAGIEYLFFTYLWVSWNVMTEAAASSIWNNTCMRYILKCRKPLTCHIKRCNLVAVFKRVLGCHTQVFKRPLTASMLQIVHPYQKEQPEPNSSIWFRINSTL